MVVEFNFYVTVKKIVFERSKVIYLLFQPDLKISEEYLLECSLQIF